MRSMTVAVTGSRIIVDKITAIRGAPAKLAMSDADASINDVRCDARAGDVIGVAIVKWEIPLINSIQSPGCRRLGRVNGNLLICLNEFDVWIVAEAEESLLRQISREAQKCVLVNEIHLTATAAGIFCC